MVGKEKIGNYSKINDECRGKILNNLNPISKK
jgi:hypothetical protein